MSTDLHDVFQKHPLPWQRRDRAYRLDTADGESLQQYDAVCDANGDVVITSATSRFELVWQLYLLIPPEVLAELTGTR